VTPFGLSSFTLGLYIYRNLSVTFFQLRHCAVKSEMCSCASIRRAFVRPFLHFYDVRFSVLQFHPSVSSTAIRKPTSYAISEPSSMCNVLRKTQHIPLKHVKLYSIIKLQTSIIRK